MLLFIIVIILLLWSCDKEKSLPKDTIIAHPNKNSGQEGQDGELGSSANKGITAAGEIDSVTPLPPLHFTRYVNYDLKNPKVSSVSSPVRKWLAETQGVTIQEVGTQGDARSKLQSMMATNSLPDVMTLARGEEFKQLVLAGKLLALDEYIEKYPNIRSQISKETLNLLRSEDGKIYMLPNWFISAAGRGNGLNGYVINTKIYKELGSPLLDTFTDLNNYLNLVRHSYPDVVPLLMGETHHGNIPAQNIFYTGFAEERIPEMTQTDGLASYPVGNDLESILTDPALSESLLYISKLFREQLLSPDALNRTKMQNEQTLIQGNAAVYVGFNVLDTISRVNKIISSQSANAEVGYEMIWPIRKEELDRNAIYPSTFQTLGYNAVVITINAQEPERIFEFLDWSISEEATRIYQYGPPGLVWDEFDAQGAPIFNKAYKQMSEDQLGELELGHYVPFGSYSVRVAMAQARELMLPNQERDWGIMANYNVASRTSYNSTQFINLTPDPESEEGVVAGKVQAILSQAFLQIAVANSDEMVLSLLEQAKLDAETAGYAHLLEWKTEMWQQNLDKMKGD